MVSATHCVIMVNLSYPIGSFNPSKELANLDKQHESAAVLESALDEHQEVEQSHLGSTGSLPRSVESYGQD